MIRPTLLQNQKNKLLTLRFSQLLNPFLSSELRVDVAVGLKHVYYTILRKMTMSN